MDRGCKAVAARAKLLTFYSATELERGGTGSPDTLPDPPKNHKNIGILSNTGPDPLKIQ